MEVSISQQITFPDGLWFLTKLNCYLLDLALALLDSKGDDVQVHADAAQLDILGGTTALQLFFTLTRSPFNRNMRLQVQVLFPTFTFSPAKESWKSICFCF